MTTHTVEGFSLSRAAILDGTTGAEAVNGQFYGVDDASLAPDASSYDNTGDDTVLSQWNWLNYAKVTVQGGYVPFDLLSLMSGESLSGSSITLTTALTTGSPTTSLAVSALTQAVTAGDTITVTSGTHTQNFVASSGAAIAAVAIPVTSQTANFAYPIGSTVSDGAWSLSIPMWTLNSMNAPPRPMWIEVPAKDSLGAPCMLQFVLYRVQFAPFSFVGPKYKTGLKVSYSGVALMSTVDEKGVALTTSRAVGRLVSAAAS